MDEGIVVKTDGSYAAGECLKINGEIYCFKQDTYMVSSGWYQIDGIWYYFRSSGGLATSRWVETNGMWYYVDEMVPCLPEGRRRTATEWMRTESGSARKTERDGRTAGR